MKIVRIVFSGLIFLLLLSACSKRIIATDKENIVVSAYPYELIVRELTGDLYNIRTLFPANASPHTYSPVPDDLIALETASLVIINGLDLEQIYEKALHNLSDKIFNVSNIFPEKVLIKETHNSEQESHHNHSHSHTHSHSNHNHKAEKEDYHHHGEYNPHIWTDPEFLIDISRSLAKKFISLNQENEDFILSNLQKLEDSIQQTDFVIRKNRADLVEPAIIYFHDAFAYFNRRYSINTAALIQAFPGKEPSPSELTKLKHIIQKQNVKAIVTEPQLNPKSAEIIAKEFNLKIITLDPLGTSLKVNTIAEWLFLTQDELFKGL